MIARLTPRGLCVLAVALISATAYLLAARNTRVAVLATGDEPHYLVMTESLVEDRDLDLRNNYADGSSRGFFPGSLGSAFQAFDFVGNGTLRSIHYPGLPLLLAAPYAVGEGVASALPSEPPTNPRSLPGVMTRLSLGSAPRPSQAEIRAFGGYLGALIGVLVVTVALSVLMFRFALELTGSVLAAFLGWGAVFLTNPLVPYSTQLYPEVPAALVLAGALWAAWRRPAQWRWRVLAAISLGILPWLHPRYAPAAGIALLYLLYRFGATGRASILALSAPLGASVAALIAYCYVAYGDPSPMAPYKWAPGPRIDQLPTGVLGLLLDQNLGLLVYSPVYVFVLLWWLIIVARRPWRSGGVFCVAGLIFASELLLTGAYPYWGGGFSISPRFLVPVLPLGALPLAMAMREHRSVATRGALALSLAASFTVLAYTISNPLLYYDFGASSDLLLTISRDASRLAGRPLALHEIWPSFRPNWIASPAVALVRSDGVGRIVDASDPSSSPTLLLDPTRDGGGSVQGPPVTLRCGDYTALAWLKVDRPTDDPVATLDVVEDREGGAVVVASRQITGNDFFRDGPFPIFDLPFTHSDCLARLHTHLRYLGTRPLVVDALTVIGR